MLYRIFHIIFFLAFGLSIHAQKKFNGKVSDESNGAPLAGASVYFNNTSIGAVTNEIGEFTIPNAIAGELIISCVGYDRMVMKLHDAQINDKPLIFRLVKKSALLRDVLILSDATRKRYLKIFVDYFLGITEEADRSTITNISSINFSKADEHKAFIAYADTPLVIINKKLGYIIRFELVEFYFNERTGATSFSGFTRYEDMGDKKRWVKNRRDAYYGSTMHFFRSLIKNEVEKEHYSIQVVKEDSLKTKSSTGQLISYKKIDVALPVTAGQIVKKDSATGTNIASWQDKLIVQYYQNPSGKYYLSHKVMLAGNMPTGFRSQLKIISKEIRIDEFGILQDPLDVLYSGYWTYEKVANLLPYNYNPNAD